MDFKDFKSVDDYMENFVLSADRIEGEYKCKDERYLEYINILGILKDLEGKSLLKFTADNPNEPYVVHTICVDIQDETDLPTKEMRKIFKGFKETLFSIEPSPSGKDTITLTFTRKLYKEV